MKSAKVMSVTGDSGDVSRVVVIVAIGFVARGRAVRRVGVEVIEDVGVVIIGMTGIPRINMYWANPVKLR